MNIYILNYWSNIITKFQAKLRTHYFIEATLAVAGGLWLVQPSCNWKSTDKKHGVLFSHALTRGTSVLHEPCAMSNNVRESEEEKQERLRKRMEQDRLRRQQETSKERDARSCSNSDCYSNYSNRLAYLQTQLHIVVAYILLYTLDISILVHLLLYVVARQEHLALVNHYHILFELTFPAKESRIVMKLQGYWHPSGLPPWWYKHLSS